MDYAKLHDDIAGVILLGYSGEDLASNMDWQLYKREIETWISPDIDTDHDGYISKREASAWPEFHWNWLPNQDKVAVSEIEAVLRKDSARAALIDKAKNSALYSNGIFNRGPIYKLTASLKQDIFVFTGELDVQTPFKQAQLLSAECQRVKKQNCEIMFIQEVGHCFSKPRSPRKQRLLDATLGPVDENFQSILSKFAQRLRDKQ